MKKAILFILISSVLLMCACSGNYASQKEPDVTTTVTSDFVNERYSKILYDFDISMSVIHERAKTGSSGDYVSDHERNIDDSFYYRMFKVEGGGYFYVFIRKLVQNEEINSKHNDLVSHFAYVEKPMKMSDFSGLSVGDTLSDVEAVDPGARYVKSYAPISLHLCSDGLVVISYDEYIEGQERKILSISFNEDYTFFRQESVSESSDVSGAVTIIGFPYYSCAIAPEDYPKE